MTRILASILIVCLCACSSSEAPPKPPLQATLTGLAWLDGPLAEAPVEIYAMTDAEPTRLAFTAETDAAGRFELAMGAANGDLLVRVLAPGGALEVGVFALPVGGSADVRVTPITHLATTYARWRVRALEEPTIDASLQANRLIHRHFGEVDHTRVDPISFGEAPTALDEATQVGLMLDGLRWQARRMAEAAGLTPDGRITTLGLTAALATDLEDGVFDGRTAAGPLSLAGHALSADTLRADYALAIARFLQSEANTSRFTPDDVRDRLDAIEQADGPLFPPEAPAGRLDIEPPVITLDPAGGVARGELHIIARATDESAITSLRFTTPPLDAIEAIDGRLEAIVDTIQMADGQWGVTVEAVDARGNVARETATFTIANTGPAITVMAPDADAVVRGVLVIEARADDPDGVTALALTAPRGLADLDPTHDALRVELETAAHPDGPLELALTARDAAGNETTHRVTVVVDNVPVAHLAGVAALGSPILGAVVEAWSLDADGQPIERIDLCDTPCRTDEDGRWSIPMTDAYAGPARVVLRSNPLMQASHLDAFTGDVVLWPEDFMLSLFVPFAPGQDRDDLAVHGLTTLADATAMAYVSAGQPLLDAQSIAADLWAAHLCDRCRPSTTPPLDLATTDAAALDPPMLLGLAHAGLSALAAELVAEAAPIYGIGLLRLLIADVADGMLDGIDGTGDVIRVIPGAHLDAWTTRERLALAIDAAVRGPRNASRVTPDILIGPDRLLDAIAMRTGPLWPIDAAPRPYDHDPPTVHITGPAADSRHGPRTFRLTATITDPGGVDEVRVVAPAGVDVDVLRESPDDYIAIIDVHGQPEGVLTLAVEAVDRARNVGRAEVDVIVDHTSPTIMLTHPDGSPVETSADDPYFVRARGLGIVAAVDEPVVDLAPSEGSSGALGGGRFLIGVDDYQPGQSRIDIAAVDEAGNEGRASFWLHFQAEGPRIDIVATRYAPADDYDWREVDCAPLDERAGSPEACDIELIPPDERTQLIDAAALAPGRAVPITLTAFPVALPDAPPPRIEVALTDTTGRNLLQLRSRRGDGSWSRWRDVPPRRGQAAAARTVELPGAAVEVEAGEVPAELQSIELRAIDHAGNITTRTLRWQRRVIAPPVSWRFDASDWQDADRATPGGYQFHRVGPYAEVTRLGFPENRDLARGVRLARWIVHNPWSIPIAVGVDASVDLSHTRNHAWRTDRAFETTVGLDGQVRAPCPPGHYYLGSLAWNERRSDCARAPNLIAEGGQRLHRPSPMPIDHWLYRAPLDDPDALSPAVEAIDLDPGQSAYAVLAGDIAPLDLIPNGYEVDLPSPHRLYRVESGEPLITGARPVERDEDVTWTLRGVQPRVSDPLTPSPPTRYHPPTTVRVSVENPPLTVPDGVQWR